MTLSTATLTRFIKAMNKFTDHADSCPACYGHYNVGDGGLCVKGRQIITDNLAYADTEPKEIE